MENGRQVAEGTPAGDGAAAGSPWAGPTLDGNGGRAAKTGGCGHLRSSFSMSLASEPIFAGCQLPKKTPKKRKEKKKEGKGSFQTRQVE